MTTQTTQSGNLTGTNEDFLGDDPILNKDTEDSADNDITPSELEFLDDAGTNEPGDDDDLLDDSTLDDTDEDGEELNEKDDLTGDDLDVPGSEMDDEDELTGDEDEENNSYSSSDQEDEEEDDRTL